MDTTIKIPNEKNTDPKLKLLNQGAYGCVFQPGFDCSGDKESTKKHITKVQKKKNTSDKETKIGALVRQINAYKKYFAPIIETCDVDLSKIKDNEVQKCDFIDLQNIQSTKFEINKIRYVGSKTLADYFHARTRETGHNLLFFKQFIHSYIVLMQAARKLADAKIIHFDLKENNIMCRQKSGRPIIIDFGLSIHAENITSDEFQYTDAFFTYGPDYPPWCIDICILTYIVRMARTDSEWKTKPVRIEDWNIVINDFITQNTIFPELLTSDDTDGFRTNMSNYFQTAINNSYYGSPTWKTVYDALINGWNTWDSYAIAVIYLQMMSQFHLNKYTESFSFMKQFLSLMKEIILATPDKRIAPKEILTRVNSIFSTVPKKEAKNLQKGLLDLFKNKVLYNKRERNIATSKLKTRKREETLYALANKPIT